MHTIKPIDVEAISRAARETGAIVTAENHSILNGLGSAVAETLCENDLFVPLQRVGVRDLFRRRGNSGLFMERFGPVGIRHHKSRPRYRGKKTLTVPTRKNFQIEEFNGKYFSILRMSN